RRGGILSLCSLIEEHGEAIEYDLISLGLRLRDLGSDSLSWRDLKVIVQQSPRESAIARSVNPEVSMWGIDQQLMAELVDVAHWLKWSKTKGATQKPPQGMPDPIPRPGVGPKPVEVIKFDVMTQDEALAWLGWDQPQGVN
ncbi:DUF5361 domain-containing protein, partial [Nocardia cyriacigeorgica]|uniref:DUF5361 domain-containing protein n=1 Tax=Nocardia cyriacigeorgica TaxID=135487 RepID=UPI001E508033